MSAVFENPWLAGLFADPVAVDIWSPDRQLRHMLAFEAALTRAFGEAGTVSPDIADDLAQRIKTFAPDMDNLRERTARDGLPVPALVGQLKAMAADNAKAVHTGATSQDVMDTALSLTLKEFNDLMADRLAALSECLDDLAQRYGDTPIMGRTRMQAALPITVRDRVQTWAQPVAAHSVRLAEIRNRVEVLQLGGAVGNRDALPANAEDIAADMAQQLGLRNPPHVWHTSRDNVVEYAGLLALISGTLGKMGQDICLMAQQGIDEITLSGGGGSSAMPHKQNPILAELLVTLARFNATQLSGMHHAMLHEQERSGSAWMLEWMILPDMAQTTARSLLAATEVCGLVKRLGAAN